MYTSEWLNLFQGVAVKHLASVASDHYPLLIDSDGGDFSGPKTLLLFRAGLQRYVVTNSCACILKQEG